MEGSVKSLMNSFEKHTVPERRWGKRRPAPTLAAYYWNGETPKPHRIGDVSTSGAYLLTEEHLSPGVMLLLTMQREDLDESNPDRWIAVHALVIRRNPNGVALSFVFPRTRDSRLSAIDLANGATRDEMARFLSKLFEHDDCQVQGTTSALGVHAAHRDARYLFKDTEPSRTGRKIKTSKVCICNLTRETLVSSDMRTVNTVNEPLKALVNDLSHVPSSGFWLTPFRGLPSGHGLSRFDVIFLDDNYRIAECAEQFSVAESGSFRGTHASALVVPSGAISSSQFRVGDQLRICNQDSSTRPLTEPLSLIADSSEETEEFKRNKLRCLRNAAPPPAGSRVGNALRLSDETHGASSIDSTNPAMTTRFLRWLFPGIKPPDRRRAQRISAPDLVAFHNTAGEPKAHNLGDVSSSGFYLLTDERWLPGTRIVMTLQKESRAEHHVDDWSRVESKVVRWGADGVGFEFVAMNNTEILKGDQFERVAFERFLASVTSPQPNVPHIVH